MDKKNLPDIRIAAYKAYVEEYKNLKLVLPSREGRNFNEWSRDVELLAVSALLVVAISFSYSRRAVPISSIVTGLRLEGVDLLLWNVVIFKLPGKLTLPNGTKFG